MGMLNEINWMTMLALGVFIGLLYVGAYYTVGGH